MDFERNQRRQSIRIIVSEAIMVLAVVIMVALLAFAASGYWFNADFGIERQGMLQISSIPTGADVEIDGSSSWLQKTNTSKVLSVGEHMIVLTKEGYDTWSKEITISEGLLYRIHYPRLFLKERFVEKLFSIEDITSATISSNHETLMLMNNTTEWKYFNLSDENLVA
ncbi:MAG: PEGA domain-containing protein, partial [Candidatus Saccharibacteria bacterium]|nr:PEGA domain-containing protein [Candidatus Saccharibacteria bacterium]